MRQETLVERALWARGAAEDVWFAAVIAWALGVWLPSYWLLGLVLWFVSGGLRTYSRALMERARMDGGAR